jgi:hypothetical protein
VIQKSHFCRYLPLTAARLNVVQLPAHANRLAEMASNVLCTKHRESEEILDRQDQYFVPALNSRLNVTSCALLSEL